MPRDPIVKFSKVKIVYFNSSHWDREWYQPFQEFRFHLVATMRRVLDTLENDPAFTVFCFDGQSIVIEDVLAAAPELETRLRRQLETGRLKIGPWYVQPDEFLVSGEALIHNLLYGRTLCRRYGAECWQLGYLCDTFGHIAAMPQILAGFGIGLAALWRGVPPELPVYFRWRAADGSEVLLYKMPAKQGYGDFTGAVTDFFDRALPEAEFAAKAKPYCDARLAELNAPVLVLMDGVDHAPIHRAAPAYVEYLQKLYPDCEVTLGAIDEILPVLENCRAGLPVHCGELACSNPQPGGFLNLITHTLSSHIEQKRRNDRLQTILERLISPLCAATGEETRNFLDLAWQYLLQNHAHDSICGCSPGRVHLDMEYRFRQVEDIVEALRSDWIARDFARYTGIPIERSCPSISGDAPMPEADGDGAGELALRIYNPLPYPVADMRRLEVRFPRNYRTTYAEPFGYETINSFVLTGEDGGSLPYGIAEIRRNELYRRHRYDARFADVYTLVFAPRLRASGWTTIRITPSAKPVRHLKTMPEVPERIENRFLRLTFNADGTFEIFDKRAGRNYGKFNQFLLDGEIGDGWNHVSPKGGTVHFGGNTGAELKIVGDYPGRTEYEITRRLTVPARLEYRGGLHEQYRGIAASDATVEVKAVTRVIFDADSPRVQIAMTLDNPAADCRIRLRVPRSMHGNYQVAQTFGFLERPSGLARGEETGSWREPERPEKNFRELAGSRDETGSFYLLAGAGLHEIAASDGEFLLTLLRSFRRTVGSNGEEPTGVGRFEFDYALLFEKPDFTIADAYLALRRRSEDLISYVAAFNPAPPAESSFVTLEAEHIDLSILKPAEERSGALVLRLCNYGDQAEKATLRFGFDPAAAHRCNLAETVMEELPVTGRELQIEMGSHQLYTVIITPNNPEEEK